MGLPDLKAVLAQRQAPAPESTPAAAREEKEEGRKALITRQLGVYPEIEVALRYIREADQRHSDLASSERSDPFCAEYTAVNFGSEFFDVLKIPLAFYGLPNKRASRTADSIKLLDAYVNRLTKELQRQIKAKGKKSISADLRHALQTMPPAVYRLPKEYEVPTCLFPILYEHPYYVFLALLESAPDREMETLLCGHPEYAYHLLTRCPKLLTRSLGEAITATASDPFWSLKWLDQNYAEAAYDFMMDHSYQTPRSIQCRRPFLPMDQDQVWPAKRSSQVARLVGANSQRGYRSGCSASRSQRYAAQQRGAKQPHVDLQLAQARQEMPHAGDGGYARSVPSLGNPVHRRCKAG